MSEESATEARGNGDEAPTAEERELAERRRVALAQIRQFGDPVLNSPASPVEDLGPELEREAERMFAIMRDALGIGLAATQLGIMRRMLVFQSGPDAEPRALVNPRIEWASDDAVVAEEGCLSLARVAVDVERPLHVRVGAHDTSGEPLVIEASGLEARVLQHEIDHLDGILMLDRTERKQRRAALRALRRGEAFAPSMLEGNDPEGGEEAAPAAAREE